LRYFIIMCIFAGELFSATTDCTQVFEDRKHELLIEIEKIDEARQSFEALQAATNSLFDKQRTQIKQKKAKLDEKTKEITVKESKIKKMLKENKSLLDKIKGAKKDKISETYNKMKDSAAAAIIEALPLNSAASIMFSLSAKKVSKIMAKMDPQKASDVTQRISVGPPFQIKKAK